ncbi:hypothetical protein D9M68_608160 [compost metagenome]
MQLAALVGEVACRAAHASVLVQGRTQDIAAGIDGNTCRRAELHGSAVEVGTGRQVEIAYGRRSRTVEQDGLHRGCKKRGVVFDPHLQGRADGSQAIACRHSYREAEHILHIRLQMIHLTEQGHQVGPRVGDADGHDRIAAGTCAQR